MGHEAASRAAAGGRPRSRAGRTCRNPPPELEVLSAGAGGSVALVASGYHVRRASLLLGRCHQGEVAGLAAAVTVQRGG